VKTPPPSRDEIVAVADLRGALRRFTRETDRRTSAHGLSPRRYELLLALAAAEEPSTMGELTDALSLTPQSVTELVARAEESGLVSRATDASDGRVTRAALTAEGERRLAAVVEELRPERARLAELLGEIYERARALDPGPVSRQDADAAPGK
jgi:DNA-binding MarR family transcriptional regulator